MNPQHIKPERSPTAAHIPEAPPSYYDFPPTYTASSSDSVNDDLPAYCPRDGTQQNCRQQQPQNINVISPTHRIYTVMPRQAYAIHMSRTLQEPVPSAAFRRRRLRQMVVGTFFVLVLASVVLSVAIIMAVSLV